MIPAPQPQPLPQMRTQPRALTLAQAEVVGEGIAVTCCGSDPPPRQILAPRDQLEVTSRDRLFLQLANLPQRIHAEVAGTFGGGTLLEITAKQLASRVVDANVSPSVLLEQGYPEHIVQMVRRLIATKGASSS